MNEVELHWYNQLTAKRTPEGYRHCTHCDSQRPIRFFTSRERRCVDCVLIQCTECPNRVPHRELSKDGACGNCVETPEPQTTRKNNRVVDGKKVCRGACGMLLNAFEDFYLGGGIPKSECKKCYNEKRKSRASASRSRRARYGVSERAARSVHKDMEGVTVPTEPVLAAPYAGNCSFVDWSISKRERYMLFAPADEYDPVEVFYRDNWECQLCGGQIPMDTDDYRLRASVDHVVPVVHPDFWMHGDTLANVQAAHARCNSIKGNRV